MEEISGSGRRRGLEHFLTAVSRHRFTVAGGGGGERIRKFYPLGSGREIELSLDAPDPYEVPVHTLRGAGAGVTCLPGVVHPLDNGDRMGYPGLRGDARWDLLRRRYIPGNPVRECALRSIRIIYDDRKVGRT